MEDLGHQSADSPSRGRKLRAGLIAAGAAIGLTLAGFGVASGQSDNSSTTTTVPSAEAPARGAGPGAGHGMRGGKGPGMGIHGEFVTRAPNGGYQTIATQRGEVTAVNDSSLTVKSEDDFSRTYVVNDDTLVNAGNNGIADVKTGDQVHVTAVVRDGSASAVDVRDTTQMRALHEKWAPGPPPPPAS